MELVVEVWSPGNSRGERESKIAAYATAGVPFLWTVEQHRRAPAFAAFELDSGQYRERSHAAAPIPITINTDDLHP